MTTAHIEAVGAFDRKIKLLCYTRAAVQGATLWLFIWGVVVLVCRFLRVSDQGALWFGLLGGLPMAAIFIWRARLSLPALARVRAAYDRTNACGGIVMTGEVADMSSWLSGLPSAAVPKIHWRATPILGLLAASLLFAGIALLLPERLARLTSRPPLEVGQIVGDLQAEVRLLEQEKLLPEKKAEDLQRQLADLQKDASGYDPSKTWEALDHIKQSNSDVSKLAAEEALKKIGSIAEAESFAMALQQAAGLGMEGLAASQAAKDLAARIDAAKLNEGLLSKAEIPPGTFADLDGLNREQLEQLMKALAASKGTLGLSMSNLAKMKLVDPKTLSQMMAAGQCSNPSALTEYLSKCTNGCSSAALSACLSQGRGGPGRGGPGAAMRWDNNTSEDDLKFKEHALPPSMHLTDAQRIGVSRSAPQLSADEVQAEHGALAQAAAGGGSANTRLILPEHRQTVRRFFKRDEP